MSCNIHSIPQMSKLNKRDQRPVAASVGICRCQQQSCITNITRTMHWPQQICSDPHNQTDIPAQKLAEEARMSFRNSSKNKHASCRVGVWRLEAPALCTLLLVSYFFGKIQFNPFKTNFSLTFSKKNEYIFLSYVSIEELFRK